jgi:hypothetical protein
MDEPLSPEEQAAYDAWFRAKAAASLAGHRPGTPHAEVMQQIRAILDSYK